MAGPSPFFMQCSYHTKRVGFSCVMQFEMADCRPVCFRRGRQGYHSGQL